MPDNISNHPSQPVQTNVQARVQSAIANASRKTGVDFDYLVSQARVESNFNPSAKASTSSASGLYQFTRQTWLATVKEHGAEHGLGWAANSIQQNSRGYFSVADPALKAQILSLRNQPEAASAMVAEFAGDNHQHLSSALGRRPEEVDLYLAHFLGARGASRFLKAHDDNPHQAAAPLFSKAAAANRGIFYEKSGRTRSLHDVRELFKAKLGADNPAFTQAQRIASRRWTPPLQSAMPFKTEAAETTQPQLKMLRIEPMPEKLSLDFAHDTYKRLAAMSGRRA